jgi:hypothetical protein
MPSIDHIESSLFVVMLSVVILDAVVLNVMVPIREY